jgi:hypothetical protein
MLFANFILLLFFSGVVWKTYDPHTFFSSGKDGELYQHEFREATRPADRANPVGVDLNIHGDLMHASSDKLVPTMSKSRLSSFNAANSGPQ